MGLPTLSSGSIEGSEEKRGDAITQQHKQIKKAWLMGLRSNEMGLKYTENVFLNMFQLKEKRAQQENISHGQIIYQSDGNSETVDHTEARDQPKNLATTIFQFRSSQDISDFWSIQGLWSSLPCFYKLLISMFD
ncbi:hypothetical protein YC2023_061318 [Brassica napus]